MTQTDTNFKAGYVAIVGAPNVGKSTLLNHFIGEKLSIVTYKAQTTRHKITGILTSEEFQIIFQDTPGYLNPEYLLHERMMGYARNSIEDSNVVLMMIDATKPEPFKNEHLLNHLSINKSVPVFLIVNKIDEVTSERVDKLEKEYLELYPMISTTFKISAEKGTNTKPLLDAIVNLIPVHPPFFPVDDLSIHSIRFFVEELIREKIFLQYEMEIPYSTAVLVTDYKEREGTADYIEAEIIVERSSQKIILIGKNGSKIKELGKSAREDIEKLVGKPVFIKLFVKVREQWRRNDNFLNSFGYDK